MGSKEVNDNKIVMTSEYQLKKHHDYKKYFLFKGQTVELDYNVEIYHNYLYKYKYYYKDNKLEKIVRTKLAQGE